MELSSLSSFISPAAKNLSLLLFMLDDQRYAIPLAMVHRVYPAVEIAGADSVADDQYLGFVNVHGELIPVINLRGRFALPAREMEISDMMIVVAGSEKLAIIVDSIGEVLEYQPEQLIIAESLLYAKAQVSVISFAGGAITSEEMRDFLARAGQRWLEENTQSS